MALLFFQKTIFTPLYGLNCVSRFFLDQTVEENEMRTINIILSCIIMSTKL